MTTPSKPNKKARILLTGEFSGYNSGISILQKAILERLYRSGKFEIAELPMGMMAGDPKIQSVPWQVFPALPHPQDEVSRKQAESYPFGGMDGAAAHGEQRIAQAVTRQALLHRRHGGIGCKQC